MFRTLEISDPALAPAGLHFVTVKSAALGQRADLLLFVPPQAAALQDVPLVLLLHGVYGSHWAWAFKGGAHLTAQRLIDAGAIPPMVLAMPSDGLWGDGSGYVPHAGQDFERWIVDEVPAAACQVCGACSAASPLFVAGLSMGGFGALRLAGRYPQRFLAAAGHSSVTEAMQFDRLIEEARTGWSSEPVDRRVIDALRSARGPLPALRFDCGRDDPFIGANRQLHTDLQAAGISHEYAEHDGSHGWGYWSRHLEDTLRFFGAALETRRQPS
ncbi:alpha/beta hydrolase [Rubrivivax rivuli]|uniref:Esterase n=1 Tax=Rubrivivax rivuli TaxID=1862385 RepID=A0A437R8L5_9BURK|nr:alpha/beta hydrolase-fold protein [Rubrivivax rivuli]RVU43037.1 esterase [Rubrivivax rivuli]